MAGNDYRKSRAVLHCVVDAQVYVALKCLAGDQGRSVTDVVNELLALEVERNGYVGVGSGDREGPSEEGGVVGEVRGGGGGGSAVGGVAGRGVDWDAIFAQGRSAKPVSSGSVSVVELDPIEEIA